MLRIVLAAAECETAWRHFLDPGEARAGWECVGPLGLARRIGRVLGVPAEPAAAADRLAAWAARIDKHDDGKRSYSASRRNDPFGVAAFLLSLRDRLRSDVLRGAPPSASRRLADLAALEAAREPALPAGLADVLQTLAHEVGLRGRLPVGLEVRLVSPRVAFSECVLRLLDALAQAGAQVESAAAEVPRASAETDLGRLQRALLEPPAQPPALRGDGTFLVVESDTALEAAEMTAALAGEKEAARSTFVVAAEARTLDAALARQGLPTLGISEASRFRPHLQLLPLRLALAFRPRDPFRAAELLLLPCAPLPHHVRRCLLEALNDMPGIGSPEWTDAVTRAVAESVRRAGELGADPEAAQAEGARLAEGIDAWFGGATWDPQEGIPAAEAASLCDAVAQWAARRVGTADEADAAQWLQASSVARTLQRLLVARPPHEKVPQVALGQLHDLAVGAGADLAAHGAEAGRPAVCSAPGAVVAAARHVVWFGFVHGAGASPTPPLPWTDAERNALTEVGVRLPVPGQARETEARDWKRPVLSACERLVLVRWRLDGAALKPAHPLLDELRTRTAPGSIERCTHSSEAILRGSVPAARVRTDTVAPAPAVAPRVLWKVPAAEVAPQGTLSATALESLLGCPFKWALEHPGALRPGRGVSIPEDQRLVGSFAHRILQGLLFGEKPIGLSVATPADAKAEALRAFDERVGVEAVPLARPGREVERDAARSLIGDAAAALVQHLQAGRWTPVEAEKEVAGTFAGLPAKGFIDLVIERDGAPAILDLKRSGEKYKRKELQSGHALQLALYADMLRKKGEAFPPFAYLTLDDGQILTTHPVAFPDATVVQGPTAQATLEGAEQGFKYWKGVLAKERLPSLREGSGWEQAVEEIGGPLPEEDGPARRSPPCRFCNYGTLCQVSVGEEVTP